MHGPRKSQGSRRVPTIIWSSPSGSRSLSCDCGRWCGGRAANRVTCGTLIFDVQLGHFEKDGLPVRLTAFEWRVLSALMLRKNTVVERRELLDRVYEYDADVDSNSLEVIVGRLRRKIGADMIRTIRGRGYLLTVD